MPDRFCVKLKYQTNFGSFCTGEIVIPKIFQTFDISGKFLVKTVNFTYFVNWPAYITWYTLWLFFPQIETTLLTCHEKSDKLPIISVSCQQVFLKMSWGYNKMSFLIKTHFSINTAFENQFKYTTDDMYRSFNTLARLKNRG